MRKKKIHIAALVCFVIAILFYFLEQLPAAKGVAALGIIFEIAGWFIWISKEQRGNKN